MQPQMNPSTVLRTGANERRWQIQEIGTLRNPIHTDVR